MGKWSDLIYPSGVPWLDEGQQSQPRHIPLVRKENFEDYIPLYGQYDFAQSTSPFPTPKSIAQSKKHYNGEFCS